MGAIPTDHPGQVGQAARRRKILWAAMLAGVLELFGLPWCQGAHGQPSIEASTPAERRLEWALLHLKLDLKGLPRWNRQRRQWQPYVPARGGLTVVNLWSRACKPCLAELPALAQMAQQWQQGHPEIRFMFVADPPDQTTPSDVVALWTDPVIDLLPGHPCPGDLTPGSPPRCLIKLPDSDPGRADRPLLDSIADGQVRPVTLLVDGSGVVRHAFVGALNHRLTAVNEAIDRLLTALKR